MRSSGPRWLMGGHSRSSAIEPWVASWTATSYTTPASDLGGSRPVSRRTKARTTRPTPAAWLPMRVTVPSAESRQEDCDGYASGGPCNSPASNYVNADRAGQRFAIRGPNYRQRFCYLLLSDSQNGTSLSTILAPAWRWDNSSSGRRTVRHLQRVSEHGRARRRLLLDLAAELAEPLDPA